MENQKIAPIENDGANSNPKYDLLATKFISEKELAKMPTSELEALVDNPIRGKIVRKNELSSDTVFLDVLDRKNEILELIAVRLGSPEERRQAISSLWNIANSSSAGLDISFSAAIKLRSLNLQTDSEFLKFIEKIVKNDKSKMGEMASFVLYISHYKKTGLYKRSSSPLRFLNYRETAIDLSRQSEESQHSFAIYLYQRVQEMLKHAPSFLSAEARETKIIESFFRKKEKIDREKKSKLPPLGIEIQGLGDDALPVILKDGQVSYVSASPEDYKLYESLGGFFPSPDKPYEFALRPSKSTYEISLVVQSLFNSGLIKSNNGSTGLDITVEGLKMSAEEYREPMILQIMMLAAGYGSFNSVMDFSKFQLSWDIDEMSGGRNKKGLVHARFKNELKPADGQIKPNLATEMRIFALDNPFKTYRMLSLIQEIASLAIEHQKSKTNKKFGKNKSRAWIFLTEKTNVLFSEYGLPNVEEHWRYADLKKLSDILNSENGQDFKDKMFSLLTKARLTTRGHNKNLIKDKPAEVDNSKKVSFLLRALKKYREKTNELSKALNLSNNNEVIENVDLARRYYIPIYATLFSGFFIGQADPSIMAKVAAGVIGVPILIDALTNAETYLMALKSAEESFKKGKLSISKDLYNRTIFYQLGMGASIIFSTIHSILTENPTALAWSISGFIAMKFGRSVIKPYVQMESRLDDGHE